MLNTFHGEVYTAIYHFHFLNIGVLNYGFVMLSLLRLRDNERLYSRNFSHLINQILHNFFEPLKLLRACLNYCLCRAEFLVNRFDAGFVVFDHIFEDFSRFGLELEGLATF